MDLTRPKTFPPIPSSHADEDTIELYALGRLAAPEAAHLETHLLICSRCQAALTEAAEFAGAMKSALAARAKDAVEFGPEAAGSARSVNPIAAMARRMGKLLQMPSVAPAAIAGLLAAVALVAVNVRNPEANRTPAEVELRSLRGGAAESDANTVDYDSNTVEYRSNRAEAPRMHRCI